MGLALWVLPAPGQAAVVTQLDITGGSMSLNFGSLGTVTGNFTANGQLLIMNQFQADPEYLHADYPLASHLFPLSPAAAERSIFRLRPR